MIVVNTRNVITALRWGVDYFKRNERYGTARVVTARGMRTLEAEEPVCTVYAAPTERVVFSPARDANPFFHFFEALWMLAGRKDLAFVEQLSKNMANYSDDGETLWGAYGWRWRSFFGLDQLGEIIAMLRAEPDTRRAVLGMWDPSTDLLAAKAAAKDVPCNTTAFFKARDGKLNMTVCNRSNDMIWGCYGANAVHMSMLQEYIADKVGLRVGTLRQVSDSLHIYLDNASAPVWERLKAASNMEFADLYAPKAIVQPHPMRSSEAGWDADLDLFMDRARPRTFKTKFFRDVVAPLWCGWEHRSQQSVAKCAAEDWRLAASDWLIRRETKNG